MNSSIPMLNAAMADYYLNNEHNEEARQLFERLVSVHFSLILICYQRKDKSHFQKINGR